LVRNLKWDRHLNPGILMLAANDVFVWTRSVMGPNVRTRLPFHRRPRAMLGAIMHKMANSVADTVSVYNEETDIAKEADCTADHLGPAFTGRRRNKPRVIEGQAAGRS
jgi:hypothetical protein